MFHVKYGCYRVQKKPVAKCFKWKVRCHGNVTSLFGILLTILPRAEVPCDLDM